ncbi:hypothetical protein ACFLQL_00465 [Verrucomicrobiota bacterium]
MIKKLPTLYKRTETGAIQIWTMCIDKNGYYSIEGLKGGKMTTNKPTIAVGLNVGKKNETTPEEQALKEAQAKWKKKTEKGYSEDIKKVDNKLAYFKPMLCHKYEDYKKRVDFSKRVYIQPKLDGQRCIARKDGLWSRNGKPIISVPHIYRALKLHFDKNPDLIFDGELYCDKFKNDFNQIMHLVRQQKPTAQDLKDSANSIQYWIYDLPSNEGVFSNRLAEVGDLLHNPDDCLVYVQTERVFSQKDLDEAYTKWIDEGFEGQIIRLDTKYENKRSRDILKRKEFQSKEYPIVSVEEGLGNKAGMAGYMILKLKGNKTFKSNIKGSHTLMEKIWKNKKNYVGKTATCKFFQLTPDGVPRFPYVIDVAREDFE